MLSECCVGVLLTVLRAADCAAQVYNGMATAAGCWHVLPFC